MSFSTPYRPWRKLKTLLDVGLGYIIVGQSATTLSGGEAQTGQTRARTIQTRHRPHAVHTRRTHLICLHFADIELLLSVINQLSAHGNTIVIIEHNLT